MFFLGTFAMGVLRARMPKLALMGIFGTIVMDVFCSTGPCACSIHHREDVPHPDVLLPRHRHRVACVCLSGESGAYVAVSVSSSFVTYLRDLPAFSFVIFFFLSFLILFGAWRVY
jgi:hypothetical protein